MRTLVAAVLMAGLVVTCAGPAPTPDEIMAVADPGPIAPLAQMPIDFMLRQTVTAEWGVDGESQSFEAVVQQVDGLLTIVALSPAGQPGFVVTYDGVEFAVENHTDRELPFPPAFMVGDVQRVFYPWAEPSIGDVTVVEEGDDSPARRTFTRAGEQGAETLVVTMSDWGPVAPASAELTSWYGYTLQIETYEAVSLD